MNPAQPPNTPHIPITPSLAGNEIPPASIIKKIQEEFLDRTIKFSGSDRRSRQRIPRTLEITVQPLDEALVAVGTSFFAITRDISQGGLSYLSSRKADFTKAVVALNDGIGPGIVCKVCNTTVIHCIGLEEVCLTNVEFMQVYRPPADRNR